MKKRMKIMATMTTLVAALLTTPALATQTCADAIHVSVNGLVCDFCARALEKVFGRRDDVAGIEVNLANGHILVQMKPDQTLDDATLKALITDSGYDITAIHRGCEDDEEE